MRRLWGWITGGVLLAAVLAGWAGWTYRLSATNHALSLAVEADRQRNFSDMADHVAQIQSLLGKGLVAGTTSQNMRYMSEAYHHATAATTNFTSLPLPAELSAAVGKFLKQTGDFAQSVMHNEAAGRSMDDRSRSELARLRQSSVDLSAQMQAIATKYNQGGFRWSPPARFSWSALTRPQQATVGRPPTAGKSPTQDQAPANMVPGGWEQVHLHAAAARDDL
jgi:germination protein YpeB